MQRRLEVKQNRRSPTDRRHRRGIAFLLFLVVVGYLLFVIEQQIRPVLVTMAEYECREITTDVINQTVMEDIAQRPELYENLYQVETDVQGNVASVHADPVAINQVKSRMSQQVSEGMRTLGRRIVYIPVGTLTGLQLLSGRGPELALTISQESVVSCDVVSSLHSAGINQTEMLVFLRFTVQGSAILAGHSRNTEVQSDVCVAQVVMVGEVPQTYLQTG